MSSSPLVILLVVVSIAGAILPWIAGAVIARRAATRWRWPEARLAFFGFLAMPLIGISATVVPAAFAWFLENVTGNVRDANTVFQWSSFVFTAASAAATAVIAVALYRIARRASQNRSATEDAEAHSAAR